MVSSGRGRFFRRKDNKYLIYLPMDFAEDSMFPFPLSTDSEAYVKVSFKLGSGSLVVEKWAERTNTTK